MLFQVLRPALRSSIQRVHHRSLLTSSSSSSTSRSLLLRRPNAPLAIRFLSQEARDKISEAVKASPIVLFMKGTPDAPQCGFSRAAIQVLQLHGVPPEKLAAYNVLEDPELRSGIKEFSEWPTIPQIYVNGEFIGGCDILLSMHQSGDLETLLENNNIIPKIEPASESSTPAQ